VSEGGKRAVAVPADDRGIAAVRPDLNIRPTGQLGGRPGVVGMPVCHYDVGQRLTVQTPIMQRLGDGIALPGDAGVDQHRLRPAAQQVGLSRPAVEHHAKVRTQIDDVHISLH
jgi:hypothetical protein